MQAAINSLPDTKVSFNHGMVIKACAMALKKTPKKINSQWKKPYH
jgi:hypothetical protein